MTTTKTIAPVVKIFSALCETTVETIRHIAITETTGNISITFVALFFCKLVHHKAQRIHAGHFHLKGHVSLAHVGDDIVRSSSRACPHKNHTGQKSRFESKDFPQRKSQNRLKKWAIVFMPIHITFYGYM